MGKRYPHMHTDVNIYDAGDAVSFSTREDEMSRVVDIDSLKAGKWLVSTVETRTG